MLPQMSPPMHTSSLTQYSLKPRGVGVMLEHLCLCLVLILPHRRHACPLQVLGVGGVLELATDSVVGAATRLGSGVLKTLSKSTRPAESLVSPHAALVSCWCLRPRY